MKTFLVFVYGSLLKGLGNHSLLQSPDVHFVCNDSIRAKLFTSNWSWPFIVFSQSSHDRVLGEVYEVPYTVLRRLDGLEGYQPGKKDGLFIRKHARTIKNLCRSSLDVYVYEGGSSLQQRLCYQIINGDWRDIKNQIATLRNNNIPVNIEELKGVIQQSRAKALPNSQLPQNKPKLTKAQFIATFCLFQIEHGCSFDPASIWCNYDSYVKDYSKNGTSTFFKTLEEYFITEKLGEEDK